MSLHSSAEQYNKDTQACLLRPQWAEACGRISPCPRPTGRAQGVQNHTKTCDGPTQQPVDMRSPFGTNSALLDLMHNTSHRAAGCQTVCCTRHGGRRPAVAGHAGGTSIHTRMVPSTPSSYKRYLASHAYPHILLHAHAVAARRLHRRPAWDVPSHATNRSR